MISDLCKLLERVGTEASLPLLRKLADHKEFSIRITAGRAAESIENRKTAELTLATLVVDLSSPDHNRCKKAVELLSVARVDPAQKAEVARALEALFDDQDGFMRQALMKAAAAWGDDQTADLLAARLEQKDLRDWKGNAPGPDRPEGRRAGGRSRGPSVDRRRPVRCPSPSPPGEHGRTAPADRLEIRLG